MSCCQWQFNARRTRPTSCGMKTRTIPPCTSRRWANFGVLGSMIITVPSRRSAAIRLIGCGFAAMTSMNLSSRLTGDSAHALSVAMVWISRLRGWIFLSTFPMRFGRKRRRSGGRCMGSFGRRCGRCEDGGADTTNGTSRSSSLPAICLCWRREDGGSDDAGRSARAPLSTTWRGLAGGNWEGVVMRNFGFNSKGTLDTRIKFFSCYSR